MSRSRVLVVVCLVAAGCAADPEGPADGVDPRAASALVTGWSDADIGTTGLAGAFDPSGTTLVLAGAGADIWGKADAFHFGWQTLRGDGSVIARVDAQQATNAWAKAGVMIRESTASGARYVYMAVTPGNGAAFQRRTKTGASATTTALSGIQAPYWMRVVRSGNRFTASVSADGTRWTAIGSTTMTMSSTALAGLAVTSHDRTALSRVTFSNVSVAVTPVAVPNQAPSVALASPVAGASFTTPAAVTLAASASDADGTIAKVEFFAGSTLVGTATSSPFEVTTTMATAGTWALTARATDNSGAATTSAAVSVTVIDPAPVPPPPNQAPTVALTSPVAGASFTTPAAVTLAASASDPDGTIAKVEFFVGATPVGTATASPFAIAASFDSAGTYAVTARATDDSGAVATSDAVSITVVDPAPVPPPPTGSVPALRAEAFNATSSTLGVRWTAPVGATAARLFLAPEPPATAGVPMPAEVLVSTLAGTASSAQVTGLAPAADFFFRVEVDTPQGLAAQVVHGRTLGGPRAPLDNAVREVHGIGPSILQVVLFNGVGSTWQAGPWTVTRRDGSPIAVTRVSRHSVPISAPQFSIGYGLDYSDSVIDSDHRVFLTLAQPVGGPDLLQVRGPAGVSFTLPFSDRYLETPSIQLNQVGYNPRATERWAYVSGFLGDGGALSLADFPATADVLSEPADDSLPRPAVRTGLAITQRSALDDDAGAAVNQIDLSSVPPAEGVRLRVRIPGVGVSWPTQVSEVAAFKAFFTVERGLFLNRWGQDIGTVLPELPRGADHTTVFTGEITDIEGYYSSTTPQTGARPLVGGYHDAGDFDQRTMHQVVPQVLMRAYEIAPSKYLDGQLDLPESGNGVPDLLDEAMWGIKAWVALQEADGGVRMGVQSYRHPNGFYHADDEPLPYWTLGRDANTTARAAGLFAQMSRLISPFDPATAADLKNRAVLAFGFAQSHAAAQQFLMYGASELFRLTGEASYDTAFQAAWNSIGKYGVFSNFAEFQLLMGDYKYPGQVPPDYFLGYMGAAGASATLRSTTVSQLTNFANNWVNSIHNNHAHRSPRPTSYVWDWGIGTGTARFMDTIYARTQLGGVSAADQQKYLNAMSLAADYALGGNPLGLVFFTQLGSRHPEEPLHLDFLTWAKEGYGAAPGIPVYGPIESMPSASYMAPAAAAFYPAFSAHPKGLRYGDVRTLVNTNEFSVWEVSGPFVEMFAILAGPASLPPASWKSGGAQVLDPLP